MQLPEVTLPQLGNRPIAEDGASTRAIFQDVPPPTREWPFVQGKIRGVNNVPLRPYGLPQSNGISDDRYEDTNSTARTKLVVPSVAGDRELTIRDMLNAELGIESVGPVDLG